MKKNKTIAIFLCICLAVLTGFLIFPVKTADVHAASYHDVECSDCHDELFEINFEAYEFCPRCGVINDNYRCIGHFGCSNTLFFLSIEGDLYCPICGWKSNLTSLSVFHAASYHDVECIDCHDEILKVNSEAYNFCPRCGIINDNYRCIGHIGCNNTTYFLGMEGAVYCPICGWAS